MNQQNIRNFAIIAHVDHGKSTLADRLLEITKTIPKEKMAEQFLHQNPISRRRGITIKLAPVRMLWHPQRDSGRASLARMTSFWGDSLSEAKTVKEPEKISARTSFWAKSGLPSFLI